MKCLGGSNVEWAAERSRQRAISEQLRAQRLLDRVAATPSGQSPVIEQSSETIVPTTFEVEIAQLSQAAGSLATSDIAAGTYQLIVGAQ